MADDIEKLVLSISADTTTLKRALARMESDTSRSTRAVERDFVRMGTNVEQNIRRASTSVTQSLGATKAATQNLQFQLNDIATSLASGASPFTVMAQQAGQVTQSLSGAGGLMGALRLVGGAVLNPISIATLAITGLAAASTAYFRESSVDTEEANRKLEAHKNAIKAALDAWDGAPPQALLEYNNELDRAEQLATQRGGLDALIDKKGLEPIRAAAKNLKAEFDDLRKTRFIEPELLGQLYADFQRIEDAVAANKLQVTDLLPLFTRLKQVEEGMGTASGFDKVRAYVENLISLVRTLNSELANTRAARDNLGKGSFNPDPLGSLGPITSEGGEFRFPATDLKDWNDQGEAAGEQWMTGLYGYLRSGQARSHVDNLSKDFASRLNAFLQASPERIEITSGARTVERQAELWQQALAKYGSASEARKWTAPPGRSRHNSGEAADLGFSSDAAKAWAHQNAGAFGLGFRLSNEDWHVELAEAGEQAISTAKEATDAWAGLRDATVQTADATKAAMQTQQEWGNVASTAISGITSALQDGKITAQEWLGIGLKIIEQLLTMKSLGAGMGGGGGGNILGSLLGGIGSIFGFANGGIAQNGKPVSTLGIGSPKPISIFGETAQAEAAVPLTGGRKIPVNMNIDSLSNPLPARSSQGGASLDGIHITVGVSADSSGNLLPFVESVSQKQARKVIQVGFRQYDRELQRGLWGRVQMAHAAQG